MANMFCSSIRTQHIGWRDHTGRRNKKTKAIRWSINNVFKSCLSSHSCNFRNSHKWNKSFDSDVLTEFGHVRTIGQISHNKWLFPRRRLALIGHFSTVPPYHAPATFDAHLSVVSCVCVFLCVCVCDVDFSAKEQQTEAIDDSFESLSTLVDPNRLSEFFDQYFDHSDR